MLALAWRRCNERDREGRAERKEMKLHFDRGMQIDLSISLSKVCALDAV